MHRIRLSLASILLLACANSSHAQLERGRSELPKVGTTLSEITIYDDCGDEFSTKALRGHYSVLVFGCLT